MTTTPGEAKHFLELIPEDEHKRLVETAENVSFKFGERLVEEGEAAECFFVLLSGRARAIKRAENGDEVALGTLGPGDVIGEISVLNGGVLSATVRATTDVTALRFERKALEGLLRERPALKAWMDARARRRLLEGFLRAGSALEKLPAPIIKELASALVPVSIQKGEVVIRQGDPPGPLYIVESGRLKVEHLGDGDPRTLAYLREGDVVGEMSLLKSMPRSASVIALGPSRLLALEVGPFRALLERPEFRRAIEERIASFDSDEARLPLDFDEENLPAQATSAPAVPPEEAAPEAAEDEHPFASPEGYFKKKKPRRWFPFVFQVDEIDCGAACIDMVCRYHGKRISPTRIRAACHTATDGTSLTGLARAATELGLAARTARVSPENTEKLPLPAILHWDGYHWVILVDVRKDEVRISNPASGDLWLPRAELEKKWDGYACLFDYTEAFEKTPESRPSYGWMLPLLRPHAGVLLETLGVAIVAALLTLLVPVLTQVVVDRVLVDQAERLLGVVMVALVATFLLLNGAKVLQGYLLAFVAVRADAAALDLVTRSLLALPASYFHTRRTGDIERRLDGIRYLRQLVVSSGVQALLATIQLVVALGLMLVYSPWLALVFLAQAPLYAGLTLYASRRLRPLMGQMEESYGKYKSDQIDAIRGFEALKAGGGEFGVREGLLARFLEMSSLQFRADRSVLYYQGAVSALTFLSSILFLWLGARMTMAGSMTLGVFMAFNALVAQANGPILLVLGLWDRVPFVHVLLDRLADVFDSEPEQGHDRSHLIPVHTLSGDVELRAVSFRYGGPESPWILRDVSLKVPAGKTIAIVGRSGSGKTTLVKLLAGLLKPTEGAILFDSIDQRTLNYRDLRRHLGYVLQENYMFSDTILKNIAFGEDADLERAVSAARAAAASEFIERLPLGYHTKIGEGGLLIAGGQKQRIAIARALYREPSVVIFDEATSALDSESERAIQENMKTLLAGKTAFIIAHRLSTVRDADRIVVLEKGSIVEQGTHDELMARRGLYFFLASRQTVES
jgi:ATP-binding cassette subfamily B protein